MTIAGIILEDGMRLIKTVLHPTDFSAHSDGAFNLACALCRDHGARLVVMHVGPVVEVSQAQEHREQAESLLGQLGDEAPDVPMTRHVLAGDPAPEILWMARETSADLIVMGTHGRTGLRKLLMGSVAELVSREALCPVLTLKLPQAALGSGAGTSSGSSAAGGVLLRERYELAPRTILYTTDFSDRSGGAFDVASSLARCHGARLVVLHVVTPPMSEGITHLQMQFPNYPHRIAEKLAELYVPTRGVEVEYRMEEGDVPSAILKAAVESGADLIVMGTHGRTGLGKLLMGSVAEGVVQKAACPVLTVKNPAAVELAGAQSQTAPAS